MISLVGITLLLLAAGFVVRKHLFKVTHPYKGEPDPRSKLHSSFEMPFSSEDKLYVVDYPENNPVLSIESRLRGSVPPEHNASSAENSIVRFSVPLEHIASSAENSIVRFSVPRERNASSAENSMSSYDVPEPSSASESSLRIIVPPEHGPSSAAESVMRIAVPPELNPSSASESKIRINIQDPSSASESLYRISVPAEHSLESDRPLKTEEQMIVPLPSERSDMPVEAQSSSPRPDALSDHPRISPPMSPRDGDPLVTKEDEEPEPFHCLQGHYLYWTLRMRRWRSLLCLLTVLLSNLFFLGVFYRFLEPSYTSTEVRSSVFFSNYDGDDVKYYIWSMLLTTVLSLILTAVSTTEDMMPVDRKRVYRMSLIGICAFICVMCVILVTLLNLAVCYEYAGRWCVGFLWCTLTEVCLMEFLVAGFRMLLIRIKLRKANSS